VAWAGPCRARAEGDYDNHMAGAAGGGGRAATAAAAALILGALGVIGWALGTGGPAPLEAVAVQRDAVYVGPTSCDDARLAAEARSPATPWCTLRRALSAAPTGAEVLVAPGRYPPLELDGRPDKYRPVDFRAQSPEQAVLERVVLNSVEGISFTGFAFVGGAQLINSSDMRLEGNRFSGGGIYIRSSRGVRIVGNTVRGMRGEARGLLAQGSADPDVPGNVDLVISGNTFADIEHDAVAVYNSHSDVRITDNRITNIREPEDFEYHTDAMQLMGGEDVVVRGNVIDDVTHGILIKDGVASRRLRVSRNLVTDSSGAGLQIFNAPHAQVSRNTVWGTRYGMILDDVDGVAGNRIDLTANVVDELLVYAPRSVRRARGNVFGRGTPVGRGARVGMPRFVDERRGDLRIRRSGAGPVPGAQLRVR